MTAPTYRTPVNGVSLSEAEAEAASIAPIGRVPLDTLEFYRRHDPNRN